MKKKEKEKNKKRDDTYLVWSSILKMYVYETDYVFDKLECDILYEEIEQSRKDYREGKVKTFEEFFGEF